MTLGDYLIVDPATVERTAWTLLHSLWQGTVIAILLGVAIPEMQRRSAHARYVTLCIGLVAMLAAPVLTFWWMRGAFDDPGPLVVLTTATAAARSSYTERIAAAVRPWAEWLLLAWLLGTGALAARQFVGWLMLQRILMRRACPLGERWKRLTEVATQLRLPYVQFYECGLLDVPATVGWLKPVVLLPASALTGLAPQQLEAIVAHELAHIRRRDYLVNLLQTAAEVLLFYHPAVWWVSRHIREERENCCDDIAATVTGGGALAFANALLALEERRAMMPLAMAATGGVLWERVARLVGAPQHRGRRTGPMAMVLSLAIVATSAGHVFSSAISVRPERRLQDVNSLSGAVYELLGVASTSESFLPPLQRAVAEMQAGALSDEALDSLAHALHRSRHDQLETEVLPRVRVDALLAHQQSPGWRYGSVEDRGRLITALWTRARDASSGGRQDRTVQLARASLLLAAQDSFMFGVGAMQTLLDDGDFAVAAGLTQRQWSRLRRHVTDHRTITIACAGPLLEAQRAVDQLQIPNPHRDALTLTVRQGLMEALRIGGERHDVQWRVACISARLCHCSGAQPSPELAAASSTSAHFTRWLKELRASASTKPSHPVRMTTEQFRRIRRD